MVFVSAAAGAVGSVAGRGSGPPAGSRVVTFGWRGAWAELRSVDTAELAVVPDWVDLGAASALPVAGVTALQAVRRLGSVIGRTMPPSSSSAVRSASTPSEVPSSRMRLLDPQIGRRGPWNQASEAAEALLARRVPGKVVLDVRA